MGKIYTYLPVKIKTEVRTKPSKASAALKTKRNILRNRNFEILIERAQFDIKIRKNRTFSNFVDSR